LENVKVDKLDSHSERELQASYLLSIDNGTQSVRALLFDTQGNLVAKGQQVITPYFSAHPGWAEQEPDYYWDAVKQACDLLWQDLSQHSHIQREQIVGMSITTQRATVINLDASGKPLRPAIIWLDQRHAAIEESVKWPWNWLFKIARVEDIIKQFMEKSQAIWIRQNQPEIWAKTDKYLLLSGFLNYKFTDNFVDSIGSQVGYIPFDYKKLDWLPKSDWRWQMLAIKPEMLPKLIEPGELIGHVTNAAALHTGIPEGLPIIASASDKACEIIGSGGNRPHIACLSFGTTATINITTNKYVEATPHLPPFPSAIPRHYSSEVMIFRGFWLVSWFKKEFGLREQRIADEQGIAPEVLFDQLVEKIPAGSMGLMLQPYWTPGARSPGPEAKGGIIGFGDVHTRTHIYRAILEGLAYALREGRERISKRNGVDITTLRVSGGGSQSDVAMQLTANIFNLAAERPHTFETSGLGAAIVTAVGLGIYPDFDQAIAAMTRVGQVFEPQPELVKTYDDLYHQVYLKMYKQLQPLYQSIREITGYPQ
jgi:sugar (pentulose or hexulose) kinase